MKVDRETLSEMTKLAFLEELGFILKIADFALTGPGALVGAYKPDPKSSGFKVRPAEGTIAGPTVQRQIKGVESGQFSQLAQQEARDIKMQRMLQSGEWNPKTHTFNTAGEMIPKQQRVAPTQGSAVTNVARKPMPTVGGTPTAMPQGVQRVGPGATQPHIPMPPQGAPQTYPTSSGTAVTKPYIPMPPQGATPPPLPARNLAKSPGGWSAPRGATPPPLPKPGGLARAARLVGRVATRGRVG